MLSRQAILEKQAQLKLHQQKLAQKQAKQLLEEQSRGQHSARGNGGQLQGFVRDPRHQHGPLVMAPTPHAGRPATTGGGTGPVGSSGSHGVVLLPGIEGGGLSGRRLDRAGRDGHSAGWGHR